MAGLLAYPDRLTPDLKSRPARGRCQRGHEAPVAHGFLLVRIGQQHAVARRQAGSISTGARKLIEAVASKNQDFLRQVIASDPGSVRDFARAFRLKDKD